MAIQYIVEKPKATTMWQLLAVLLWQLTVEAPPAVAASHGTMVNLLESKIAFSKVSRRNGNESSFSNYHERQRHFLTKRTLKQVESNDDICDDIMKTVLEIHPHNTQSCTCHANSQTEYLVECDYSSHCGPFCSAQNSVGPFDCFRRMDRYIVQVTDDDHLVNTMYEGCGTYVKEGTRVCLMELHDLEGELSERCLNIDGLPCQCHRGSCGDFVFQCFQPGLSSKWTSFVLDECDELQSYGQISPGKVHGLLSSNIFSNRNCVETADDDSKRVVGVGDPPSPTERPSFSSAPSPEPTWTSRVINDYVYCTGLGCSPAPTNPLPPTKPPTAGPTIIQPTSQPTKQPTMIRRTDQPSRQPMELPTSYPIIRPSNQPTKSPTTIPPTNQPTAKMTIRQTGGPTETPTVNPTLAPSLIPTTTPTVNSSSTSPSASNADMSSLVPTTAPSDPWPTVQPSLSTAPTIHTVDLLLEPFTLIFALVGNHSDWQPPTMIRAVQQFLVTSLREPNGLFEDHDYSQSLYNFRLQCSWVDTKGPSEEAQESRLECMGHATLNVNENDTNATGNDLVNAQAAILLQDEYDLSVLLSNQLGESIDIIRVEMEAPSSQQRGGETKKDESSAAFSVWDHSFGLSIGMSLVFLWM